MAVIADVVVGRQSDFLRLFVHCERRRLAGSLNGGQQKGDQDADDGNRDQQFDQRKGEASSENIPKATDARP